MKHFEAGEVKGWLHEPKGAASSVVALTHGAGSNCEAPFLKAAAEALAAGGFAVLRYDLPFQREGVKTLSLSQQTRDREGITRTASALRARFSGLPLVLAGHSYGGRQSSMLAAEQQGAAHALLLL